MTLPERRHTVCGLRRLRVGCSLAALILFAGSNAGAEPIRDNILILIIDDIGVDQIGVYAEGKNPPPTPNIDRLAAQGVLFRNAWAYAWCSPTRATLLTGRYGFRTGIGQITTHLRTDTQKDYPGLDPDEITIPKMLGSAYQSAAIGKWHLAGASSGAFDIQHPLRCGFDHFSGTIHNLSSYTNWVKIVDGKELPEPVRTYATRATVNDTLERIAQMREPWFTYVAFHAAHSPMQPPPAELHSQQLRGIPRDKIKFVVFRAIVESLDREIGRLLEGISKDVLERTTIFLLGDNGTRSDSVDDPLLTDRGKGTHYESGINVPFIVTGPRVAELARGAESAALVQAADIFATIAEIAGVEPPPTDSVSFLSLLSDPTQPSVRSFVYAEYFKPNGAPPYRFHTQAIREHRFKLHRSGCVDVEFYDLAEDPDERINLLDGRELTRLETSALARLHDELDTTVECRTDRDRDGLLDPVDNCVKKKNADQLDSNGDGIGDACETDSSV